MSNALVGFVLYVDDGTPRLRAEEWFVDDTPLTEAQEMVKEHHYARGGSKQSVYVHGLYRKENNELFGIAWWLPPTKPASVSVNPEEWKKVLSLTRLVILPGVPKNACSFLLSRSMSLIRDDKRFVSLVTYADESQSHKGGIYHASNWAYIGRVKGHVRWVDGSGRQVSTKATVNRTYAQMEALGYIRSGPFDKHKFIMHLDRKKQKTLLKELAAKCHQNKP